MAHDNVNFDAFHAGYIETLLWSSVILDESHAEDWPESPELVEQTRAECLDFWREHYSDLEQAIGQDGYSAEHAGHDFALTRNGHGAGFWDRGLGEVGERLTEHAHAFGSADLYLGDDGWLYQG